MKKQTLEEVALSFLPNSEVDHDTDFIIGFEFGAKWQEVQAKEMEDEQIGYSEEDVREMLFMALNEPEQECCITHTKDSIVRKVLETFKSE